MLRALPALLVLSLCHAAAAAPPVGLQLTANDIYFGGEADSLVLLAPGVQFAGQPLRNLSSPTALECAAACKAEPRCTWFDHVDPACGTCRLYNSGCAVAPIVGVSYDASPTAMSHTAGFPVRQELPDVPGFTAQAAVGVPGADLQCSRSVVPGKCGFATPGEAIIACSYTPECQGVVRYANGTDGCSAPVSLLVSQILTLGGSFVAPSVGTWSRLATTNSLQRDVTLTAGDGAVLAPSDAELGAAAGPPLPSAWLGCIVADGALMAGEVVGVLEGVASPQACCRACRGVAGCNTWNFCPQQGGCSHAVGPRTITLKRQQCELRYNAIADPANGLPPSILAKGPGVPFVGGAPLAVTGPPLPGYVRLPGRMQYQLGSLNCSQSLGPGLQECIVGGTPQEMAAACDATPGCTALVLAPSTLAAAGGQTLGALKQAVAFNQTGLTPTDVLYVQLAAAQALGYPADAIYESTNSSSEGSSSSGGGGECNCFSAGSIAGIAVGATAAACALAAAALLLVRWQLRRRRGPVPRPGPSCSPAGSLEDKQLKALEHGTAGSAVTTESGTAGDRSSSEGDAQAPGEPPPLPGDGAWRAAGGAPASVLPADLAPLPVGPAAPPAVKTRVSFDSAVAGSGGGGAGRPIPAAPTSVVISRPSISSTPSSCFSPARSGVMLSPFAAAAAARARAAAMSGGTGASTPGAASAASPCGTPGVSMGPGTRMQASASQASQFSGMPPVPALAPPSAHWSAQATPLPSSPADSAGQRTPPPAPSRPASSHGGAPPAALPPRAAGAASDTSASHHSSGSSGSERPMLAELAAHIAECDAEDGAADAHGGAYGLLGDSECSLLSPLGLPASLREWLVDIEDIEYQRWPNGTLKELGTGATATVYKATFRGETVAAKELDLGRSPRVQEIFVTEAERLHQLRHAHMVALYGVALSGGRGVLLMEYCGGRDLLSVLQLKKADSGRRLFGWYGRGCHVALDLAKALNFLHSKVHSKDGVGVVHMDVKSSNVLLTGTGTAKLADVGMARLQHGAFLSELPSAVGTFAWMAPEVIIGKRCTSAVDIYSFGVVLWEIITGEAPSRGDMRLPHVPEECPQEAADLILQCMSLEPSERPGARSLMKRLDELCHAK